MEASSRCAAADAAPTASEGRWTPAQAAEYAARRDFLLLQYLSTDRRAFATARRLGYFTKGTSSWMKEERSMATPARTPPRRAAQTQTANPDGNSSQRRSRRRAAENHAARQAAAAPPPSTVPPPPPPAIPVPSMPPLPPSIGERARATSTWAAAPAAVRSPVRRPGVPTATEEAGASTSDATMHDAPSSPPPVPSRPQGAPFALREQARAQAWEAMLNGASATLDARSSARDRGAPRPPQRD
jgi:hypothetical protein